MAKLEESKKTIRDLIQAAMTEEVVVDDKDLDRKKYPDAAVAKQKLVGELRAKKVGQIKAAAVQAHFKARLKQVDPDDSVTVDGVRIYDIKPIGENGVEIFLTQGGITPEYRIFNPPMMVADPTGEVEIRGKKHREDPLGAVAYAINSLRKGAK